jgi:hypothetical protein
MSFVAFGAVATAASAAASVYSASQARVTSNKQADLAQQAVDKQRALLSQLKYTPIDIEKLKTEATANAISNAKNSLALERELSPAVAAARLGLSEQISKDLALGGKLSPDIANQVARASRTMGALSGAPAGPLTAASIGTTAEALKQQRMANAAGLLAVNQMPKAGLDPATIARLQIEQQQAADDFANRKLGAESRFIDRESENQGRRIGSNAAADAAMLKGYTDLAGSLISGAKGFSGLQSSGQFSGNAGFTGVGDTSLLGSIQSTPVNYTLGSGGYVPGSTLSGAPSFGQGLLSGTPTFGQNLPAPTSFVNPFKPTPLT